MLQLLRITLEANELSSLSVFWMWNR